MRRRRWPSRRRFKPYKPPDYRKKRAKKVLLALVIALLLAALAVGAFFVKGQLPGAMNCAQVRHVLSPVAENDTVFFKTFQTYLARQNVPITIPEQGDTFSLGSAFSTAADFLRAVDPDYAVIPVGQGNENGHPAPSLLRRLRDAGVHVYRTDLQGTVVCVSDGKNVSFSAEKGLDADTLAPQADGGVQAGAPDDGETAFILNTDTKKFHRMFCLSAAQLDGSRKEIYIGTRDELIAKGYDPCNWCDE